MDSHKCSMRNRWWSPTDLREPARVACRLIVLVNLTTAAPAVGTAREVVTIASWEVRYLSVKIIIL